MGENIYMNEKRKDIRFETLAKVRIKEIGKESFPLRDLSVTGCRVECPIEKDIMPNMLFSLEIIPEKPSKIKLFTIKVESKWVRVGVCTCEAGFLIVDPPKGEQFQRYIDYLSWRYSRGESMTNTENV